MMTLLRGIVLAAVLAASAMAQTNFEFSQDIVLPDGIVGQPYVFFDYAQIPPEAEGITSTFSFMINGSGPPGMQAAPLFRYFGTPTTAGTYRFSLVYFQTSSGAGVTVTLRITFNCTQVIQAATGAAVTLDPPSQTISSTLYGGRQSRSLVLSNRSSQPKNFTATATSGVGNWLSVDSGGSLGAFSNSSVGISADPSALGVGTYTGNVAIAVSPTGERLNAAVTLTVTGSEQNLVLSQSGLTFQVAQGGISPPPLVFSVFNESAGSIAWTAAASTISGGNWLTITPNSGSSTNLQGREIQVRVAPGSLAPGDYYGQVEVRAPGAANSPQLVGVVMNVAPPGQLQGSVVSPTGLVFVGTQGGANPAPQTVTLSPLTSAQVTFQAAAVTDGSQSPRFGLQRTSGTLSGQPVPLTVSANLAGLPAGVSTGDITISFGDGTLRRVGLLMVVRPRVGATASRAAEGCTPRRLLPVFTQLGSSFRIATGWPVPVEARIVDDCGDPMTSGSVVATFSNNDAPVTLVPLLDGRWSWTWTPRVQTSPVAVTVNAQTTAPALQGSAQAGGTLLPNTAVPVVAPGGVLNAASFQTLAPLSPGSLVSIFGTGLSEGLLSADRLPLAIDLGGTRAILGGQNLPLVFTSSGQVNAMLPTDLPPNATMQLVVRRGNRASAPESLTIAAAQPGVFQAGERGIIVGVKADGTQFTPSAATPVSAGDVLVIFCTGLGATNPPVPAGQAVPSDRLYPTANPVTVTIGGRPATVLFGGLVAGFTGLYQVNASMPEGVTAGDAAVVLTVAGQSSKPVPLAVR